MFISVIMHDGADVNVSNEEDVVGTPIISVNFTVILSVEQYDFS